ncbi:Bestrophin-3 [Nymphon striatum]|nr:Bestrophin-3 [Nymphon striatum]
MTVSYTLEVSNAGLCGFAKLLLRWRGSIYKLMLKEMIMFIGLYYNLSIIYRYALSADGRIIFEKISIYCKAFSNLIPISFVLGFYVAIVVHRWWEQVLSVPSPDKYIHERNFDLVLSFRSYRVIGYITKSERFALLVSTYIHGSDERSRIIRRTLIRYVNLTIVMTFQLISTAVKKRFPTIDHIQEAGIIVIDITNFKINVILTYFLVELSNSPMSIMPSVLFPLYPLCAIIVVFKSSKRSLYYWLYSAVHDVSFPTTATPPTAAKSLFKVTRSLSQNEQKVTFIRNRPAYDPILMQLHRLLRLTSS